MHCPLCKNEIESRYVHLYMCPALNERIMSIHPKKGTRRSQPLHPLTHEGEKGVGRPELCNCEKCVELEESRG